MLKKAFHAHATAQSKAAVAAWLALAVTASEESDGEAAASWLARSRELDPDSVDTPVIEGFVEAAARAHGISD